MILVGYSPQGPKESNTTSWLKNDKVDITKYAIQSSSFQEMAQEDKTGHVHINNAVNLTHKYWIKLTWSNSQVRVF